MERGVFEIKCFNRVIINNEGKIKERPSCFVGCFFDSDVLNLKFN